MRSLSINNLQFYYGFLVLHKGRENWLAMREMQPADCVKVHEVQHNSELLDYQFEAVCGTRNAR